ncbi:zinc transporter ZntB [Poseidonibacter sp.]|uniref:zinc transporter ZntB n=1 Tax=Poseidonibacter sp. TaxID=2321188 RepID=UPI003C71F6A4
MQTNGFSHAVVFDGKGGATNISFEQLDENINSNKLVWVHFDYSTPDTIDWLTNKSGIDQIAIEALLTKETRPRTTFLNDSILLALRGINLNPNSTPEDMISIRLFINKNIIISTKKRDLLSVRDILEYFKEGIGPKTSAEFLIELTNRLTIRMEDNINDIEERVSNLEEISVDSDNSELRAQISEIKRETISLKKYLSPQKEAMYKLYNQKVSWVSEYEKVQLREITDQLMRYIEELDSIKDKVSVIQENISQRLSEQMNQKMYVLSIISAVFLPLGFLTGLFGINVGGIPGAESKESFYIFIIVLIAIVGLQLYIFKKKRWL